MKLLSHGGVHSESRRRCAPPVKPAARRSTVRIYSARTWRADRVILCCRRYCSMTTRQAGLRRGLLSIRQRKTLLRSGMADQQTRNASPMQACRSSEVSASAAELRKAMAKAVVMGANCSDRGEYIQAKLNRQPFVWHVHKPVPFCVCSLTRIIGILDVCPMTAAPQWTKMRPTRFRTCAALSRASNSAPPRLNACWPMPAALELFGSCGG